MKRALSTLLLSLAVFSASFASRSNPQTEIYLLTILPGKEIYSMYGHSALRIIIPERNFDQVFNWGVFDFNTPNFGYRFAKGRLNYMLAVYPYDRFLQEYFLEQRTVFSQRLNLQPEEKARLIELAFENLKPENVYYLYDFFYDNCATRIRDIIIKSLDGTLSVPESKRRLTPTFRELIDNYQKAYRWLDLGIDLLLGLPADNKASAMEQMFLPDYLMSNLSEATIVRMSGSSNLLEEPETVFDFDPSSIRGSRFTSPMFVLWSLLALIMIVSLSNIKMKWMRRIDIALFTFYSLLAILLFFTIFLTDHAALKWNLNFIWLSPLVIITLIQLILNTGKPYWYRVNLTVSVLFLASASFLPQSLNRYLVPVILILIVRLFFLSRFGKTAE
jgi:hypothetical protein